MPNGYQRPAQPPRTRRPFRNAFIHVGSPRGCVPAARRKVELDEDHWNFTFVTGGAAKCFAQALIRLGNAPLISSTEGKTKSLGLSTLTGSASRSHAVRGRNGSFNNLATLKRARAVSSSSTLAPSAYPRIWARSMLK